MHKRLTFFVTLVSLISLSQAAPAQERRDVPEIRTYGAAPGPVQQEIDALLAGYRAAWAAEDTEALMALHAPDTEWINAYARMFQGRESLGTFLKERLFPAFDPGVSKREAQNMKTVSIRYLGDDAAVVHLYTDSSRGPARSDGQDRRRTHFHLVLAKGRDGWSVAHTAIMDAR